MYGFMTIKERETFYKQMTAKHAAKLEAVSDIRQKNGLSPLSDSTRQVTAVLLENQERAMNLAEDASTANFPTSVFVNKQLLTMVLQVFPGLMMTEIADVQPLSIPAGIVFYEKMLREDTLNPLQHTEEDISVAGSSVFASNVEEGQPRKVRPIWTSQSVQTEKWILGATWTSEIQADAMAYAGVDIPSRMLASMRDEISGEIDERGLKNIFANLLGSSNVNWDSVNPGVYETINMHYNTIGNAIIDAANIIYQRLYQYPNYIIAGSTAAVFLQKTNDFERNPGFGSLLLLGNATTAVLGTYRGYTVYRSPNVPAAKMLLGTAKRGFIYSPYIPFEVTIPVYNPANDSTTQNIRTRDAMLCYQPEYFATVTCV